MLKFPRKFLSGAGVKQAQSLLPQAFVADSCAICWYVCFKAQALAHSLCFFFFSFLVQNPFLHL